MTELEKPNSAWAYAWDRFFDTVDVIVAKITSGKFIATVLVVYTYCKAIETASLLVQAGKISSETYIAIIAGMGALASTVVKDYFSRNDKNGGSNV